MKPELPMTSLLAPLLVVASLGAARARGEPPPPSDPRGSGIEPTILCPTSPRGAGGAVSSLAFSPDGKTLATSGLIKYFDPATARLRVVFPAQEWGRHGISRVAFAPDGATLAAALRMDEVALLDPATGRPRLILGPPPVGRSSTCGLAYAPDGKTLAAGYSSGHVVLWDTTTGRRRAVLPPYIIPEHEEGPFRKVSRAWPAVVYGLAFSPDGKTLVSTAAPGSEVAPVPVRAWDAATGRERATILDVGGWASLAFSPDGKTLAISEVTGDYSHPRYAISLWDAATWKKRAEIACPGDAACPTYLPDGKALAALDGRKGMRLWDAADGHPLAALRFDEHCSTSCLAVSPDGKMIAAGGFTGETRDGVIFLLETDGKTLRPYKPRP